MDIDAPSTPTSILHSTVDPLRCRAINLNRCQVRCRPTTVTYKFNHHIIDQFHKTTKSTRSSSTQLLFIPRHNLSLGSWSFRVSAPKVWNTLPLHVRQSQSLSAFRRHLKTHYFHLAYPATYRPFTYAPWFCSFRFWRFTNHLLTYCISTSSGWYSGVSACGYSARKYKFSSDRSN